MTIFAIGDVQGCQPRLRALLRRIHIACDDPELVFMGDLVNRGPESLATLRELRALGNTTNMVLGNHDLHLLAVFHGVRKPGRNDTLQAILDAPDRGELLDWLRRQPLAQLRDGHLMVHAGVLPQWTAEQTLALAHEVESVLRGPDWGDFLHEMYGNTPDKWDDGLRGVDRLRCIVNALTRMRYCRPDGTMVLNTPEDAKEAPPGLLPWFELPERKTANITVVFGHWSLRGLILEPNLIGLDTGCVWGGKLTAVRLTDRALFQVDCPQYRTPG
ncbi:MAG TPA: symmetrical bis(5'-nucleosyl)-tetraphosphatase [Paucimonas sp.]|nr:symmetrical bis(5'-nucleosyl)-tetraphosphatase [Paucimonas sp.]